MLGLRLRLLARRAAHADPLGGQFGDFVNGAQVIIDQFIASAESKWGRASGLVMLLPHGYEGQGPEHSSARLERFLALCAEDNIQVVNATTPAAVFPPPPPPGEARLPQAADRDDPKSLLRAKQAVSRSATSTDRPLPRGGHRRRRSPPTGSSGSSSARARFITTSSPSAQKRPRRPSEVAIIRLEQFYPWPEAALKAAILGRYKAAREWVWCQEESQNMGGWSFVAPRSSELTGPRLPVRRPRRQRQPGDRLAHDPRPRAGPNWSRPPSGPPSRTWSRRTTRPGRSSALTSKESIDRWPPLPIKVPKVSESISEGHPGRWLKPDGATVKAGEPLFELETDKASQVFISPGAGVLEDPVEGGDRRGRIRHRLDRPRSRVRQPSAGPRKPLNQGRPNRPSPQSPARSPPGGVANGGVSHRRLPLAPSVRRIVTETKHRPVRDRGDRRGRSAHQGGRPRPRQAIAQLPRSRPAPSRPRLVARAGSRAGRPTIPIDVGPARVAQADDAGSARRSPSGWSRRSTPPRS